MKKAFLILFVLLSSIGSYAQAPGAQPPQGGTYFFSTVDNVKARAVLQPLPAAAKKYHPYKVKVRLSPRQYENQKVVDSVLLTAPNHIAEAKQQGKDCIDMVIIQGIGMYRTIYSFAIVKQDSSAIATQPASN